MAEAYNGTSSEQTPEFYLSGHDPSLLPSDAPAHHRASLAESLKESECTQVATVRGPDGQLFIVKGLLPIIDERGICHTPETNHAVMQKMLYHDGWIAPHAVRGVVPGQIVTENGSTQVVTTGPIIQNPSPEDLDPRVPHLFVLKHLGRDMSYKVLHDPIQPHRSMMEAATSRASDKERFPAQHVLESIMKCSMALDTGYAASELFLIGAELMAHAMSIHDRLREMPEHASPEVQEQISLHGSPLGAEQKLIKNREWGQKRIEDGLMRELARTPAGSSARQEIEALLETNRTWWDDVLSLMRDPDGPYKDDQDAHLAAGRVGITHGDYKLANIYTDDKGNLCALDCMVEVPRYYIQTGFADTAMAVVDYRAHLIHRFNMAMQSGVVGVLADPMYARNARFYLELRERPLASILDGSVKPFSSERFRAFMVDDVISNVTKAVERYYLCGVAEKAGIVYQNEYDRIQRSMLLEESGKSMVRAVLAFGYDNQPDLGRIFVGFGQEYLQSVKNEIRRYKLMRQNYVPPWTERYPGLKRVG
jgi:hypothetical protein